MAKVILNDLVNLQNEISVVNTINGNNASTEAAIENTLSRDGTSPNQMFANLDMNSNRILNLPIPVDPTEPARKGEVDDLIDDVQQIADSATAAAQAASDSADLAESYKDQAQQILEDAEIVLDNFDDIYLGPKALPPTVDNDGDPLVEGQLYFNTTSDTLNIYNGVAWQTYSAATGITDVVQDTTPQLGGNLDLNGFTVGAATAADLTKLNALTADATELNYVDGVTSAIQTQLNAKQALDSDLTSWAGVTRASGFDTFAATPSSANLRALLTDETGTGIAYFVGGALGTPASGTLTNATGLPVSTGISGLGTGVATFLATPSSANLRAALTDETGTGVAYFVGGALGTPASGTLTSCTGLPAAGVVNTALVVSVENQGPLTGGANVTPKNLGTISSGTVTVDTGDRIMQTYANNGAHTLAVDTGSTGTAIVLITNAASAGAITTSAFDYVKGDPFDTTNGSIFRCLVERWSSTQEILFVTKIN